MTDNDKERKEYEKRLQRRLGILKKVIEAGNVKLLPQTAESLKKVRYSLDGTFDLSTVDGVVRSAALAVEMMHDREELKKAVSLSEIQNTYFSFLQTNFGKFYTVMRERGLTPHDAGIALSRNASSIAELTRNLPAFLDNIEEFWNQAAHAAYVHVEDMTGILTAVFGGDLFPSNTQNIASKCGIYTDTIVLPDPFIRSKPLFTQWTPERKAYYLIKHGLNLLQYRELACADMKPPIVVVLPDFMGENERQYYFHLAQKDLIPHVSKIFGRQFGCFDEIMDFARSLNTVDKVIKEVADPSRLIFDVEWKGTLQEKLELAMADEDIRLVGGSHPGIITVTHMLGRMAVTNELLVKAGRLRGTPLIDAPTSWQYFVWKLEYDAHRMEDEVNASGLHVLRGLQSIGESQMEWLGRVPPEALIELRQTGASNDIRRVLAEGVHGLASANPKDFQTTTDQVLNNIQGAFDKHKAQIKELRRKQWKFAGSDIGSWIVVGSLAVAAAATGQPIWGLAAVAADQLLDAPKLKDIPKSIKDLASESKELKQSPVGLLFKLSEEKA